MSSKNLLTIDELSQVSGLSKRTIRYYVNSGLLDRPTGETKNARYDASHLESIEFRQEICGLTQPQMIKLAQAFLEVIKSEKDKAAQEEQ